jgi:hypothetical protein
MSSVGHRLLQHQAAALERVLMHRSVGLVSFVGERPTELGSGVCVALGGRHFVDTAAHVIKDRSLDDLFLVHHRRPGALDVRFSGSGLRGGSADDALDIAWIEIHPDFVGNMEKSFIGAEQLRPRVAELVDDNAVVFGYPADLVDKSMLDRRILRLRTLCFLAPTLSADERSRRVQRFDPQVDIYVEYPADGNFSRDGEPVGPPPPAPGMSGCGIWTTEANIAGVWSPDASMLLGIQYSWHQTDRWLRGTQVHHWVEMVAADLPDLRQPVDRIVSRAAR